MRRGRATPRMTPNLWATLDAFPWALEAKLRWHSLPVRARAAVVAAARAELAANRAYVRANDWLERLRKLEGSR